MQETIPVTRKHDLVIQEIEDEILIYDLQTNKVFSLNQTSALIWRLSTGKKTLSEIAHAASQEMDSSIDEQFIWLALEQLRKENLIDIDSLKTSPFKRMKRRDVIKKVGYSSLVALPLIVSLTTPVAAQSGSSNICSAIACNCTIMFSSTMTTCNSVADCMTDTNPTCMCNSITCTGSGPGGVTCGGGVCGS